MKIKNDYRVPKTFALALLFLLINGAQIVTSTGSLSATISEGVSSHPRVFEVHASSRDPQHV